ncbi:MAG TPA: tRNA-modifying protein YgfZ, partial [Pseudomonadaceae bacterium]|nr:tRNA-modifying protein YgfZ [Pseudomonadaceae bacterium]
PALVLVGKDDEPVRLAEEALAQDDQEAERRWHLDLLLNGHYPFEASDSERYTPQELHYDSNGYVSFTKGCYTGQEIVARMHYRGKPKKQLYLARLQGNSVPPAEDLVFLDAQGNTLGAARYVLQQDATQFLALASLPVDIAPEALPLRCEHYPLLELSSFQTTVQSA